MLRMKMWMPFLALLFGAVLFGQSADWNAVEAEMKAMIADVDNGKRAGNLADREYALSMYQQIMKQDPTPAELDTMEALLRGPSKNARHNVAVKRSQLMARLLAKKESTATLSKDAVQRNMPLLRSMDFKTVPVWNPRKEERVEVPATKELGIKAHAGQYKVYYGFMHSHTECSDGEGTPDEAYQFAREKSGLDFFALTDHGELIPIWPWDDNWEKIKKAADKYHEDHVFVTLRGFEWSSPLYGHINIIHSDDFTCAISSITCESALAWLAKRPQAFGRFNHPGYIGDWWDEFDHFKMRSFAVQQMVGIEMFNGGTGVKGYYEQKGYFGKFTHIDEANQIGWKIGAVGGEDNHKKNWGLSTKFAVGIWAVALTRDGVLDAYRERRTFATEDRTLALSFKMNDAEMGSRLTPGTKTVWIRATDKDNEKFKKATLFKSGLPIQSVDLDSNAVDLSFQLETKAGDYYYVYVQQADGDAAISSPIWILPSRP